MAIIVQKFGGTSVASVQHIQNVARKILATRAAGYEVVVVVSAMGHETDRLVNLANEVDFQESSARRELDVLLSTGEQVTVALLAMMLMKLGCPARSFTGPQAGFVTDSSYTRARILNIETSGLASALSAGEVPVVTGFQGADEAGNITTFGRGGSDTTAVALAAVLKAKECQIFTDVKGVYTTDPRVVDSARCLARVTFEEMLELASQGSKVLHSRAVEFAGKYQVPLRVLSTFDDLDFDNLPGTLITNEEESDMEQPIISGIAFTSDEAKLTVLGVKDIPGIAWRILGPISEANIEVDMIVQNVAADNTTDFTFTVARNDYDEARGLLEKVARDIDAREVTGDNKIAKLSMVGVGMRSHAGVASRMFEVLANKSINIQMISTSEIKISVVIAEEYIELAARALHAAFELDLESNPKK
ncbi:MAG: aspartate kinase [Proteobacteria bacterium]|jgi:aspartate kinase|nr:aspartate kinase [Pseudomonadota bacterium]